jgi:hypothetical protein
VRAGEGERRVREGRDGIGGINELEADAALFRLVALRVFLSAARESQRANERADERECAYVRACVCAYTQRPAVREGTRMLWQQRPRFEGCRGIERAYLSGGCREWGGAQEVGGGGAGCAGEVGGGGAKTS